MEYKLRNKEVNTFGHSIPPNGAVVTLKSNIEVPGFSFQNNPAKDKLIISIEDASLINTLARIINAQALIVQKFYF